MSEKWTLEKVFDAYQDGIKVPRIQRGYVQGRNDAKGEAIRAEFVPALVAAVFGGKPLSLDFLYGVAEPYAQDSGRCLLLLDGQQRLTTLALLAWLCGKWDKRWRFDYEARRIPQLFMRDLLASDPSAGGKASETIRAAGWFLPIWKNDPSVGGMLRMLDALEEAIGERDRTAAQLENVTFLLHGIDGTGDTFDHIFRKMNARGKELSPWENLKAMLDKYVPKSLADEWREKVDSDWPECIWEHVGNDIAKLDNAMEKIVRIAWARVVGYEAQVATSWEWELRLVSDRETRTAFYQIAMLYFGELETIAGCWSPERTQNTLWGGDGNEEKFWGRLTDASAFWGAEQLRIAFLAEPLDIQEGRRRRRVLLNLLDCTDVGHNADNLLKKGVAFLMDGDWSHLDGFHKEQIADEQWKSGFDEDEIVEIERHPLVWRGSTAFLEEMLPEDMRNALAKLQSGVKADGKGLFLGLLGLCGKCNEGLPCGSIWIPKTDAGWAEECFSARRLFLRAGVAAWLKGAHYDTASGSCAWLNHLAELWNTVEKQGLKKITTKDGGWLFCVVNKNLGNTAIRLARSQTERERLLLLADVQVTPDNSPYITWGVLPYNGFMRAKDGTGFYNVKSMGWWMVDSPLFRWTRHDDGTFSMLSNMTGEETGGKVETD